MDIWLKELEIDDGIEYMELLNELSSYDNFEEKTLKETITKEDYGNFKAFRIKMMLNDNLPEEIIPTNTYWVMKGNTPIGYATLKHKVLDNTSDGHFRCYLRKEYQNTVIGNIVLEELFKIAYDTLGIEKAFYSSKTESLEVQKLLEKIGLIFYKEENGYLYYKIDLNKKFNKEGRNM